ncbi:MULTISPECIES: hypothetical protein [Xenorhabdus]|uniref:hypothetical protein n=1 Tax=Xenorhabdus TaxID=626 RepID=UPI001656C853|nr:MULTISPECIES: hypothetical protein [Xenorhabdus]
MQTTSRYLSLDSLIQHCIINIHVSTESEENKRFTPKSPRNDFRDFVNKSVTNNHPKIRQKSKDFTRLR